MGCTGTKNEIKHESNLIDKKHQDGEEIINDGFRKWLKSNRPRADDYVLRDILLSQQTSTQTIESIEDDYRTIVAKALDLISNRNDIKSITKLTKVLQKEISTASPKKVNQTLDILKQTADKLRDGKIVLDGNGQQTITLNGEVVTNTTPTKEPLKETKIQSSSQHGFTSTSTEPGIGLREALETARIYFYKGKQAAIFVNHLGGYDVKVIDDADDANHDGNLLRSVIVTEVKLRPKTTTTTDRSEPEHKILDGQEISEDFRRSIDAALAGLQQIYHKTSVTDATQHQTPHRCPIPVNILPSNKTETSIVQQSTSHGKIISTTPHHPVIQYGMTNMIDKNKLIHPSSKNDLAPSLTTESSENIILNNHANINKIYDTPSHDLSKNVKKSTSIDTSNDQHQDGSKYLTDIVSQIAERQNQLNQQLTATNSEILLPPTIDIQPRIVQMIDNVNELMMDSIESTTKAEIGYPVPPPRYDTVEKLVSIVQQDNHTNIERIVQELKEHGEKASVVPLPPQEHPNIEHIVRELKEHSEKMLHADRKSPAYSVGITSEPITSGITSTPTKKEHTKLRRENRPKSFISDDKLSSNTTTNRHSLNKQISESYLDDMTHLTRVGISNPTLHTSKSTSSTKIDEEKEQHQQQPVVSTSVNSIIEEEPEVKRSVAKTAYTTQGETKRGQNVTYTETITSQNNGEHSSRTITESYDEPLNHDKNGEQTTTLKVVTKSEFSRPNSGESIMEQSVQVITVKVRNETIKTTINNTTDDTAYERRPVSELVKNFEQET
ncbi:unnamed protein product [Didymodactylos carnosus]|uniref:Uncharacterized protein n=1 Tax=Didymodactylos carnosus TaxID=1234261 RepID=A0A813Q9I1_9BILA|nr:unnamed protein product [Didymodactylos carnosus]CAF0763922.1 unnamed protein product [Didymodactylos carnosus]CAF3534252.1 unnamed protein product [Didymodactylos carnosus]CAF3545073.1 unnamed protein product [Didymodactylos carnosus]